MPTRKSITEALSGRKSLICFVTAGDPSLEQLPEILAAIEAGGADAIEVGLPFSDPIADGPTIQASSQRALDRGVNIDAIFEQLSNSRVSLPIVLMGYTNTAMRIGFENFAQQARAAGAAGVILSDLPPEDSEAWRDAARAQGIDTIFLAAPTSTDDRIKRVAEVSTGFIYCVSRTGVTGAGSQVPPEVRETVQRIKSATTLPICVGFGISTAEHVRMVCEVADGAVVGSHVVNYLHRNGVDGLSELVCSLRAAL